MVNPLLTIVIPTYNRHSKLKEGLAALLPQISNLGANEVEVVIVDNTSSDATPQLLSQIKSEHNQIRIFRNDSNLGIDGNTAKCFEYANGKYVALLSDDDHYIPSGINIILGYLKSQDYSLVCLNYYGYYRNPNKQDMVFHPEEDRFFSETPSDIMHYPTVGHFSAFIYNTVLAKIALNEALLWKPLPDFEITNNRVLFYEIALRVTVKSKLPTLFIGKRILANTIPDEAPYCALEILTVGFCSNMKDYYQLGLISETELLRRFEEAARHMPKLIVGYAYRLQRKQMDIIISKLNNILIDNTFYRKVDLPLLHLSRFYLIRLLYRFIHMAYRAYKRLFLMH
ncbi:MAG: glycosyltransferase family 2 protein [Proteobacteria bacterium]|nr:glycosyltransferase family 2 protein [Pseudomonadota bacterium]